MPPSQISPIIMQRRLTYENDSFRYITTGAESEQPVGALFYQWVGCRDHAGIVCFPQELAQGGPICRDQRKRVFHNTVPFKRKIVISQRLHTLHHNSDLIYHGGQN